MLKHIRLELARTPEFPQGDPRHGYEFTAPLDAMGRIDLAEFRKQREKCTVLNFVPGKDDEHGHLVHTRGGRWAFHYDLDSEPADDEPGYRFDQHTFRVGEYVSITEHDGETRPFRVVSVK
ncbi:MAG: hypothetical protein AB7N54_12465 [Alphaproteobacteria bacterium]